MTSTKATNISPMQLIVPVSSKYFWMISTENIVFKVDFYNDVPKAEDTLSQNFNHISSSTTNIIGLDENGIIWRIPTYDLTSFTNISSIYHLPECTDIFLTSNNVGVDDLEFYAIDKEGIIWKKQVKKDNSNSDDNVIVKIPIEERVIHFSYYKYKSLYVTETGGIYASGKIPSAHYILKDLEPSENPILTKCTLRIQKSRKKSARK